VQKIRVAPSILQVHGIAPETLQSVSKEGSEMLPEFCGRAKFAAVATTQSEAGVWK
jgi:hypothetical protein